MLSKWACWCWALPMFVMLIVLILVPIMLMLIMLSTTQVADLLIVLMLLMLMLMLVLLLWYLNVAFEELGRVEGLFEAIKAMRNFFFIFCSYLNVSSHVYNFFLYFFFQNSFYFGIWRIGSSGGIVGGNQDNENLFLHNNLCIFSSQVFEFFFSFMNF